MDLSFGNSGVGFFNLCDAFHEAWWYLESKSGKVCTSLTNKKKFLLENIMKGTWTAVSTLLDESFLSGVEVAAGAGSLKTITWHFKKILILEKI